MFIILLLRFQPDSSLILFFGDHDKDNGSRIKTKAHARWFLYTLVALVSLLSLLLCESLR